MALTIQSLNHAGLSSGMARALDNSVMSRDGFLQLLMAQIRYQDPMSPLDNAEFVGQLTQFSILEQNMNMAALAQQQLNLLNASQEATFRSTVVGLIGREVVVAGDRFTLQPGESEKIMFQTDALGPVQVIIRDAGGHAVRTETVSAVKGFNTYIFDGKDERGDKLPAGFYTVEATAVDTATGANRRLATYVTGVVRGVDMSTDEVFLDLDGVTLPATGVVAVKEVASV